MNNITMPVKPKKLWSFDDHPEAKAQLAPHAREWIANALSTRAMDETDRLACCGALADMYRIAKLAPPSTIVFSPGPITTAISGPIACGVRWLAANETRQREFCGRPISPTEWPAIIARAAHAAVSAALGKPIMLAATRAATDAATSTATAAATDAATAAATDAATAAATAAATFAATAAATSTATAAATEAATSTATAAATAAATSTATAAATDAATDAATRAATRAATDAATRAATRAATDAATRAATDAATYAATAAATEAATSTATAAATEAATEINEPAVRFLLACLPHYYSPWQGGADWSAWACYLSFGRRVGRTDIDWEPWLPYEALARLSGPRFVQPDFAIITERPSVIRLDGANLHAVDGPAKQWGDGWSLWYDQGQHKRTTVEDVAPRATVTYHLLEDAYTRQVGVDDQDVAARWAGVAKRAETEHALTTAEEQMLMWSAA